MTQAVQDKPRSVPVGSGEIVIQPGPAIDLSICAADELQTSVRNIRMMHLLERLARKFNKAGVPLMVLKGGALNLCLYDKPHDRPMVDLDLMVRPEDLDKAVAILEQSWFLRSQVLLREDFFPKYYYEIEYTAGPIDPVTIDLHIRPLRPLRYSRTMPADAMWASARTVQLGDAKILVPSCEDMLIHLAAHSSIHGNSRQVWLDDIYRWVCMNGDAIDWSAVVESARKWRLVLPLLEGLKAVERVYGRFVPDQIYQALACSHTNWRDRLTIRQAPCDNDHTVRHVLVNCLCTPDWRYAFGYLAASMFPGREHMSDWYTHRHIGWLACAHIARVFWPVIKWFPKLWQWWSNIEVHESAIHGKGVFATKSFCAGEVIAHCQVKPVEHDNVYIVSDVNKNGLRKRHAITGKLRFQNHSSCPNTIISEGKLIALRPIRKGQELTLEYCNTDDVSGCSCRTTEREC